MPRLAHLRQGLGQHRVVEGAGGEVVEVVVGVALHHRQAPRQAGRDAFGADLQTAALDALLAAEQLQQLALAAADVEHPRAGTHEAQDLAEVLAAAHAQPPSPPERRKPESAAWNTGSSRKKASCPLTLSVSTKMTRAPAAISAPTICRLSADG